MRSLFWKIFWSFWLAIVLIGGLTFVLGRWMTEERWLMSFYPNLSSYAPQWTALYEKEGLSAAQQFSLQQARDNNIRVGVLSVDGDSLTPLMSRRDSRPGARQRTEPSAGSGIRQGTGRSRSMGLSRSDRDDLRVNFNYDYASASGNHYVFRFSLPASQVRAQSRLLFWPLSIIIALFAITLVGWLLSSSITRPIHRLRDAVGKLEKTDFQSAQLTHISRRHDELGMLARDFNRMGEHLQTQIASQRQLLRDVSHELRSPLTRLRIALGLAERKAEAHETSPETWEKLQRECDHLDRLIDEILTLSRFSSHSDSQPEAPQPINLSALLHETLAEFPDLPVNFEIAAELWVNGWPTWLEKALSNLVRNAARFNPPDAALDVVLSTDGATHTLRLRDHGPGCDPALLPRLGEPFLRAPGQKTTGYGLGLAITKRAIERHSGTITFSLPPDGGFQVEITLPAATSTHDNR
ncbi:MAG: HAMP domain-containing histidine kinase [Proteobacteria bacterium]|nr:HAMP domain-containing histidine kinase [Pseudomonadota bacterium]MCL2308253.1 HAMP domain-containing histidine kinase [Pseudomonadota bacterium]